jgi:hypothetical protein
MVQQFNQDGLDATLHFKVFILFNEMVLFISQTTQGKLFLTKISNQWPVL